MIPMEYITEVLLEDVLMFHADLEESNIPVKNGVRDMALLESAINAPFQTYGGQDLFPSIYDKAARLLYGIANNHAFVDGNKRTAIHAMEVFLIMNSVELEYSIDEMEALVIGIADNTLSYEDAVNWITQHT